MKNNNLRYKKKDGTDTIMAIMAKRRTRESLSATPEQPPETKKHQYPSRAKLAYAAILRDQFDRLEILSAFSERSVSFYVRRAVDILLATENPDVVCALSAEKMKEAMAAFMKVVYE